MTDRVKGEGLLSKGYGIIPKLVMVDDDLSIEAKAIYAYIASYAGNGDSAFPSVKKICYDLGISDDRFHKHKKPLLEKGYIEIKQERKGGGKFASNVYFIKQFVQPTPCFTGTDNPTSDNPAPDNPTPGNQVTNNNSSINNSITNNSSNNLQQQPAEEKRPNFITAWEQNGFGTISPMKIEQLDHWVSDFGGKEEIIVKAIELADDNGKRSYNYVEAILKNWENKGVKELSDIDALEKQRQQELAAKKSGPAKQYNKQPIRKETLPEWAGKPEVIEKPMDAAAQAEMKAKLEKIRAL